MDALKAEIALKRKTLQDLPAADGRPTKYIRRGDLERLKEEQERKAKEEKEAREKEERDIKEAERLAKLAKGKVSNQHDQLLCQTHPCFGSRVLHVPSHGHHTQKAQEILRPLTLRPLPSSTYPMRRLSVVFAPRRNLYGCSESQTEIVDYGFVLSNSLRRRSTNATAVRTTSRKLSKTSKSAPKKRWPRRHVRRRAGKERTTESRSWTLNLSKRILTSFIPSSIMR